MFNINFVFGQTKLNHRLKLELDSIFILDQKYRELLSLSDSQTSFDSIAKTYKIPNEKLNSFLISKLIETDSINLKRIKEIISEYGYPGKSMVGEPTNETSFYVIQHSNEIDKYIQTFRIATKNNELSFSLLTKMIDRNLMQHNKKQIYGTQGKGIKLFDSNINDYVFTYIIWPVRNPLFVNKRRKKAGLESSVEDNAKDLGIKYIVYTMRKYRKLLKK